VPLKEEIGGAEHCSHTTKSSAVKEDGVQEHALRTFTCRQPFLGDIHRIVAA
jgi:hypothetical protein